MIIQLLTSTFTYHSTTESHDGEFGPFRLGCQLKMVYENIYHSLPQQGRFVQAKTGQITTLQLLPGLLRWKRRESRRKISALEVQPGQQSASQSLPSVSPDFCLLTPSRTDSSQPYTSDRYVEYSSGLCSCERNNSTERIEGFRNPIRHGLATCW